MNRAAAKTRVALLLDRLWVAVVLSALYPTIFALSNNWYSIGTKEIIWLVAVAVAAGLAVYLLVEMVGALLVEMVVTAIVSILAVASPAARGTWVRFVRPSLFAAACAALLFVLLAGTLEEPLRGLTGVAAAFAAAAVGIGVLFAKGLQRYFNMALVLLTVVTIGSWLLSFGEHLVHAHAAGKLIGRNGDLKLAKFVERPNIYFFIYDAYGSDAAYRKVFGFDNSPHYRALRERGFKVVHTFSNYRSTWSTVLGVFLGGHHYYGTSSGRDDTKVGRNIMAGLAHNPVFETLWSRGYRIQQIHGSNYLVIKRGKLDYLFPEAYLYSALRIYSSPVITALLGKKFSRGYRSFEEQSEVLFSRLPDPSGPEGHPWLTFSHINQPGHAYTKKNWLVLKGFEKVYVKKTLTANKHMLSVMDAIVAKDPSAIVVIFGDHGAQRYRGVTSADADNPSRAFEKAGVEPEIVANDTFGVMIAVRSAGRCDDYVYPSITPVNLMRVVFACLAREPKLLENRADDISLTTLKYRGREQLWLIAKDGKALPQWQPYDRPKHDFGSVP